MRIPIFWIIAAQLAALNVAPAQTASDRFDHALNFARQRALRTVAWLGEKSAYPRSSRSTGGGWEVTPANDWTSGFFPGLLWYLFEYTGEDSLLRAAERWTDGLESEQFNRGTHDVGFMMFCSVGNGYRLRPSDRYHAILLQSAASLAERFNPAVGCIKSWDWNEEWSYPVIIDNMMNLELLFWASKNGGGERLRTMAISHAVKTMENHLRPDGSAWHVVNYNPVTGEVSSRFTHQGAADSSAWARGQAWGIYGFTMTYRETGDPRFLAAAGRLADYYVAHLPSDGVPYWDFQAPGIPNTERDASAAAIACSALLELSELVQDSSLRETYASAAEHMLASLSAPPYLAEGTKSMGILNHAVGHRTANREVDVSLIYGDYYFVEALLRYKRVRSL